LIARVDCNDENYEEEKDESVQEGYDPNEMYETYPNKIASKIN
jgi:hypothetical protein